MTGLTDGFNDSNGRAPSTGIALANAYYGQNMYWALSTTSLANVGLTALTVTGAGKGVSSAFEAGGKALAKVGGKVLVKDAGSIGSREAAVATADTDAEAGMSTVRGSAMEAFYAKEARTATHEGETNEVVLGKHIAGSQSPTIVLRNGLKPRTFRWATGTMSRLKLVRPRCGTSTRRSLINR